MFSATLLSAMLHDLWTLAGYENPRLFPSQQLSNARDLSDYFSHLMSRRRGPKPWPCIPVIARTDSLGNVRDVLHGCIEDLEMSTGRDQFFWGRVPVNRLAEYFQKALEKPPDQEWVDFAPVADVLAQAPGSSHTRINTLLQKTRVSPKVRVCVVDQGIKANSSPGNFNGMLSHANTLNIDFSTHALEVLLVLLEKLNSLNILDDVEVWCCLVEECPSNIGSTCFEHMSFKEIGSAISLVNSAVPKTLPLVLNLSMGAHVGPHDGSSPLEDVLHQMAGGSQGSNIFPVVAAGNDGLHGISAFREVDPALGDFFRIVTNDAGCTELMLELWWMDASMAALTQAEVSVSSVGSGVLSTFSIVPNPVSASFGPLSAAPGMFKSAVLQSLLYVHSINNWHCLSFVLSSKNQTDLASLEITIFLECKSRIDVNAWVVLPSSSVAFIEGGNTGNIRVPASDPALLSVAGIENSKLWSGSSRAPTFVSRGTPVPPVPKLAADVSSSGQPGTSFSAPRVSALAALQLIGAGAADCDDMARKLAGRSAWDSRIGYGKV